MTATSFSIYAQIISASSESNPVAKQRPEVGRMRSPIAHLVLAYLCGQHEYLRQHEIREALQIRHPSAAWALLCLRRWGLVDVVQDVARNPRYMRYRAKS